MNAQDRLSRLKPAWRREESTQGLWKTIETNSPFYALHLALAVFEACERFERAPVVVIDADSLRVLLVAEGGGTTETEMNMAELIEKKLSELTLPSWVVTSSDD